MFGPEYLGKAVAIRRGEGSQVELAAAIGVNKSTMNAYERGKLRIDETTLDRIAEALQCDPIDLLQDAFYLFRYNHFRRRGAKIGVTAEELAARMDPHSSLDEARDAFQAIGVDPWRFVAKMLELMRPERFYETRSRVPLWGVVVEPPSKAPRKSTAKKPKKESGPEED
jgi:transcriptional regulator with XRE-family HTH domain